MSLSRHQKLKSLHDTTDAGVLMIAPPLSAIDIAVDLNGQQSMILSLTKVLERTKGRPMLGYLIHCTLPDVKMSAGEYRITINATNPENHDKGEALHFWSGDWRDSRIRNWGAMRHRM